MKGSYMSIHEELLEQYQAFREAQGETPNSKSNKIILNQEAYDEMLVTSRMKGVPNPTMTYDDVKLVCDPDQEERILLERRQFHE